MVTDILFEGVAHPRARRLGLRLGAGRRARPRAARAARPLAGARGGPPLLLAPPRRSSSLFLNFLPFGKHFHVITALPNVFFARLPPEGALRKLDLEAEDARLRRRDGEGPVLEGGAGTSTAAPSAAAARPTARPTSPASRSRHKEVNRAIRHHLARRRAGAHRRGAREGAGRPRGGARRGCPPSPRSSRPRRSGPAPPAAGARPPARCSSRTSRASSTCGASRCSSSRRSRTRRRASSRGSRPRGTPGASARTSAPSGARTWTSRAPPTGELRVALLRRLRRRLRRPPEEGLARHRADPPRGQGLVRHPRRGGDLQRRGGAPPRQRVPVPDAGARRTSRP